MRLQLVLFALTRAQERTTVPHYAKVLSLVKKGKVFGQAFFKRLVGVWGQSPRNTTCAPLLDVRSEKLEVRNGFAAFEQSRSLLEARDLEARGKKMRLQILRVIMLLLSQQACGAVHRYTFIWLSPHFEYVNTFAHLLLRIFRIVRRSRMERGKRDMRYNKGRLSLAGLFLL